MIKSKRVAEAAFFARAYCPSHIDSVVKAWSEALSTKKLPFQPENVTSSSLIQQSLVLESKIKSMLAERASSGDYEQALTEYFRDLSLDDM